MPASKKIPEPWNSFLRELDEKATEETRLDCMGGFVVTQLYGFSRETTDLDVLVIAPKEQLNPLLELARQDSPLHKKHKVYLDYVGLRKCSPKLTSVSDCARWTPTIWRYPSWSETFNAIAMMSDIWHAPFLWTSKSSKGGMKKSFAGSWESRARGLNSQALD